MIGADLVSAIVPRHAPTAYRPISLVLPLACAVAMLQIILQILVDKLEFSLSAVHPDGEMSEDSRLYGVRGLNLPCALIVKESIRSLFVLVRNHFWLLMALEPCLILLVKSPALAF